MRDAQHPLAEIVRESAAMARLSAKTARLHNEPEEAARFEQIAVDAEARARLLEEIARLHAASGGPLEAWLIAQHEAAVEELERESRRLRFRPSRPVGP